MNTHGIIENAKLEEWKSHHFGLSLPRWNNLSGKSFWITGAGTGYGRAIAIALAAAQARVYITGRREEKLKETINEIISFDINPANVVPVVADITSPQQVQQAMKQIQALNGLVHCAALPPPPTGPWQLTEITENQWELLWQTNVFSSWLIAKNALPLLLEKNNSRLIFLSSEAGWNFTTGVGAYNVTKAALNNLCASMAEEISKRYPDKDCQLNVLVPGEARTEMNQGSINSPAMVVSMILTLLSHPPGGPNGKFFHRDGRHLAFTMAAPYEVSLFAAD